MWRLLLIGSVIGMLIIVYLTAWLPWKRSQPSAKTPALSLAIDVDGTQRRALAYAPHPRLRSTEVPLVLAFHGAGESANAMVSYSRLADYAAAGQAVVVFPEGRGGMFDTFKVSSEKLVENEDVRFVLTLLAELATTTPYDASRVYAIGMSNGATFAELLPGALPGRLAAVVGYAGGLPKSVSLSTIESGCPILLLVGDRDEKHSESWVRSTAQRLEHSGWDVETRILPGETHRWNPTHNETIWRFLASHTLTAGPR